MSRSKWVSKSSSPALDAGELDNLHEVAEKLVDLFVLCTPGGTLRSDTTEVSVKCLGMAVRMIETGVVPDEDALVDVREAAVRWAQDRLPLDPILRAYHEGFRLAVMLIESVSGGASTNRGLTLPMLAYLLEAVTTAVATAYVEEVESIGRQHTDPQALASALLTGSDNTRSLAVRSGTDIADSYMVLAVHASDLPSGSAHQRLRARRRTLRNLTAELRISCGSSLLSIMNNSGGTVLLPDVEDSRWLDELVGRLDEVCETQVVASCASAPTAQLPTIAKHVYELLDLARTLKRPAGLYRMHDLAVEYQLTRPGVARDQLQSSIAPLLASPDLVETLEVYLASERSRQTAARRLHIHTNTLDYRLKRISEITGFDANTLSGQRNLHAAIIVREMTSTP